MNYKLAAILSVALALAGCGGDDGGTDVPLVATSDVIVGVSPTVVSAFVGDQFRFASGVPEFETTAPTTLTFTGTGTTPPFSITSDGRTRSGDTKFGSCTFTVSAPANLAGSIFIKTCAMKVKTNGMPVGTPVQRDTVLMLNDVDSDPVSKLVFVNPNGDVGVNNVVVGNTPLQRPTGAGN